MPSSLDPSDPNAMRRQAHAMLDVMLDHTETLRDRPLWRSMSDAARAAFDEPPPQGPTPLSEVCDAFTHDILPYSSGNAHPGFMGWVQGGGSAVGMLAEMLAAGMNANCGGRDHAAIEVERRITAWSAEMFGFPAESSGLFTSGASAANFMGVLLARTRALGPAARSKGLARLGAQLVAYTSAAAHGCVGRAMEMAGLGREQLRLIPVDADHRIRLDLLQAAIRRDVDAGLRPFLLVGTAGSVDCGAVDDLDALADIALGCDLHLHVDGALGALGVLSPLVAPRLKGMQRADTLAFDWHKWGQAPYDAGFFLARDADLHRRTFAADAVYLARADRGLAAGDFWPCDYGPELSRGFRALKVWFLLKTHGLAALGEVITQTVTVAQHLAARIAAQPELERIGPAPMNTVCFGYRGADPDALNAAIVADLQEEGRVAPSLTTVDGRVAIRACIVNHRTTTTDVDALVEGVLRLGRGARLRSVA